MKNIILVAYILSLFNFIMQLEKDDPNFNINFGEEFENFILTNEKIIIDTIDFNTYQLIINEYPNNNIFCKFTSLNENGIANEISSTVNYKQRKFRNNKLKTTMKYEFYIYSTSPKL